MHYLLSYCSGYVKTLWSSILSKKKSQSSTEDVIESQSEHESKDNPRIRTTLPIRASHLEQIRAHAFLAGKEIGDILEELITTGLSLKKASVQKDKLLILQNILGTKKSDLSS